MTGGQEEQKQEVKHGEWCLEDWRRAMLMLVGAHTGHLLPRKCVWAAAESCCQVCPLLLLPALTHSYFTTHLPPLYHIMLC